MNARKLMMKQTEDDHERATRQGRNIWGDMAEGDGGGDGKSSQPAACRLPSLLCPASSLVGWRLRLTAIAQLLGHTAWTSESD